MSWSYGDEANDYIGGIVAEVRHNYAGPIYVTEMGAKCQDKLGPSGKPRDSGSYIT